MEVIMKFKEFGQSDLPTIILLHGGGLSWWSIKNVIDDLQQNYHVVTPIIDGHGDDGDTIFVSIEDSASKLNTMGKFLQLVVYLSVLKLLLRCSLKKIIL